MAKEERRYARSRDGRQPFLRPTRNPIFHDFAIVKVAADAKGTPKGDEGQDSLCTRDERSIEARRLRHARAFVEYVEEVVVVVVVVLGLGTDPRRRSPT